MAEQADEGAAPGPSGPRRPPRRRPRPRRRRTDPWRSSSSAASDRNNEEMILNMGPQHPSTHGVHQLPRRDRRRGDAQGHPRRRLPAPRPSRRSARWSATRASCRTPTASTTWRRCSPTRARPWRSRSCSGSRSRRGPSTCASSPASCTASPATSSRSAPWPWTSAPSRPCSTASASARRSTTSSRRSAARGSPTTTTASAASPSTCPTAGATRSCASSTTSTRFLVEFDRLISFNEIFVRRLANVAVITEARPIDYGLVGPNLRGSGVDWDVRRDVPYGAYPDFEFEVPVGTRLPRRRRRLPSTGTTCASWRWPSPRKIVRQALETACPRARSWPRCRASVKPEPGEALSRVESARGEMAYYVVSDGTEQAPTGSAPAPAPSPPWGSSRTISPRPDGRRPRRPDRLARRRRAGDRPMSCSRPRLAGSTAMAQNVPPPQRGPARPRHHRGRRRGPPRAPSSAAILVLPPLAQPAHGGRPHPRAARRRIRQAWPGASSSTAWRRCWRSCPGDLRRGHLRRHDASWWERRSPAACRAASAPTASGAGGFLQWIADAVKLLFKEDLDPGRGRPAPLPRRALLRHDRVRAHLRGAALRREPDRRRPRTSASST